MPTGPEAHPLLKELRPVFGHRMNNVWKELGPKIDGGPVGPVILWIGVVPGTLSSDDACTSANGCLDLLKEFGITNVEVEFCGSIYTWSAGPSFLEPVSNDHCTVDICRPLTPVLGLSIAAEATPHAEGTSGLYFAEGVPNYNYAHTNTSVPCHNIILLGTCRFEELIQFIEAKISCHVSLAQLYEERIERLKKKVAGEDEDEVVQAKRELEDSQLMLKGVNKTIEALDKFHQDVKRD
ncbi:hypothetical protein C0995_005293 [Termitomyces sp. Mi166|nr:hypothetical protein C0995_005293 [Termitomyces sp. Mi166\